MVVLVRGLDLSVGGILAVATVVTASAQGGGPGWIALALAVGIGLGLLNGLLVGPVGMQPCIVTLAAWTIFNGIALTRCCRCSTSNRRRCRSRTAW